MSHTTVFLILDGMRADYVSAQSTPFLYGLAQEGIAGSFESPPGFAERTALFSGRYPDTSGHFADYAFDPEQSPFRWVRRLGPLRHAIRPRRVLYPARWGIRKITQAATGTYHADPAWIPPKYLPFFRPAGDLMPVFEPEALGDASIFDLCRENALLFRYLAHPLSHDEEVGRTLVHDLRNGEPYDLYVAHFRAPDVQGRLLGPDSQQILDETMRRLDETLAQVHAALTAGYDSWDLFLAGDHGMAPVRRRVDLLAALKGVDARPGKDYVVFVHSALAAFWYLTQRGERAVEDALPTIEGAYAIEPDVRRELRIPTDRRWGDRLLAADPGVLFWPDYFHVADSEIRGVHGYVDKAEESDGLMILTANDGRLGTHDAGRRPLVDAFPTLCDLLGLHTPKQQEGTSLLGRGARARTSSQLEHPLLTR